MEKDGERRRGKGMRLNKRKDERERSIEESKRQTDRRARREREKKKGESGRRVTGEMAESEARLSVCVWMCAT